MSGFGSWLLAALDLPEDSLGGVARITITGKSSLMVENHKGLVEYSPEHIIVSGGKSNIGIRGSGLELEAMNRQELLISGQILSLDMD